MHTRSTVVERYRKRDRDFVVNEVDFCDESGRLLVRSRTHQSFLADLPQTEESYVVDRDPRRRRNAARSGRATGPSSSRSSCTSILPPAGDSRVR